jgi:putative transposase
VTLRLEGRRPERKTPAHFPPIDSGFRSVIIYLTVCVQRKRPLLANHIAAQLIVEAWRAATFWCVGRIVIMPDHIHLFCGPNTFPAQALKKWIACWKNHVTREWTNRSQIPIWQREFWDRQLRRAESYDEKMAIREKQSCTSRLRPSCRRLTVPRGTQCPRVARPVGWRAELCDAGFASPARTGLAELAPPRFLLPQIVVFAKLGHLVTNAANDPDRR